MELLADCGLVADDGPGNMNCSLPVASAARGIVVRVAGAKGTLMAVQFGEKSPSFRILPGNASLVSPPIVSS